MPTSFPFEHNKTTYSAMETNQKGYCVLRIKTFDFQKSIPSHGVLLDTALMLQCGEKQYYHILNTISTITNTS